MAGAQVLSVDVGSVPLKVPALVVGWDDAGQLTVVVLDGDLLRACALLHIAASKLDTMNGIANLPKVLPFAKGPPNGNPGGV